MTLFLPKKSFFLYLPYKLSKNWTLYRALFRPIGYRTPQFFCIFEVPIYQRQTIANYKTFCRKLTMVSNHLKWKYLLRSFFNLFFIYLFFFNNHDSLLVCEISLVNISCSTMANYRDTAQYLALRFFNLIIPGNLGTWSLGYCCVLVSAIICEDLMIIA